MREYTTKELGRRAGVPMTMNYITQDWVSIYCNDHRAVSLWFENTTDLSAQAGIITKLIAKAPSTGVSHHAEGGLLVRMSLADYERAFGTIAYIQADKAAARAA